MNDRKLMVVTLLVCVLSLLILAKFAQVGLEVQGQAEQAKRNPLAILGGVFGLFTKKPPA